MVRQVVLAVGAALLGGVLALRLIDGTAGYLVQSWYLPVLIASAGVLVLLAVVASLPAFRSGGAFALRPTAAGLVTAGLVGFPVVLGLVFQPRALGTASLDTDGVAARQFSASAEAADPARRNIYQWAYEFETSDPASLVGDEVELIGFVFHKEGDPADRFLIARFVVACCIADAQGFSLPVQWKDAPTLKNDQWIRLTGRVSTAPDGALIVQATEIQLVEAPSNPYIYP